MHPAVFAVIWAGSAFLLGSVPFGPLIARTRGVDLRGVGSGNIGATNVWRALGWRYGLSVFILDALKGLAPVLLLDACIMAGGGPELAPQRQLALAMAAGFSAVLGHTFSPWVGGRGGKGVATGLGAAIGLYQLWILPPLAAFALVFMTTRMVSAGSLAAAALLGATAFAVPALWPGAPLAERVGGLKLFGLAATLLVFATHMPNIRRMLAGKENRVGGAKGKTRP
jgi:acyl phosphate:glycerol-3-phosphate acyltransferase